MVYGFSLCFVIEVIHLHMKKRNDLVSNFSLLIMLLCNNYGFPLIKCFPVDKQISSDAVE